MPVIVDALKAHPLGFRPHIGEEVFKIIPALTDLDAAPAIALVIRARFFEHATAHLQPRVVLNRLAQAVPALPGHRAGAPAVAETLSLPAQGRELRSTALTFLYDVTGRSACHV
jgi:hypothetical protein